MIRMKKSYISEITSNVISGFELEIDVSLDTTEEHWLIKAHMTFLDRTIFKSRKVYPMTPDGNPPSIQQVTEDIKKSFLRG